MTPSTYLPPIPRPPHDPTCVRLNARAGWNLSTASSGVEMRAGDGPLVLSPVAGGVRTLTEPSGSLGGLVPPANMAVGEDGTIYLLDTTAAELKRFDPCACGFVPLACFGGVGTEPRQLKDSHGIAVHGGDLFVCDTGNGRVTVITLWGLALRRHLSVPKSAAMANPFTPFAVAVDSRGRAFVTDPANGAVHRFDRGGRWERAFTGFGVVRFVAVGRDDRIVLVIDGQPARIIDGNGQDLTPPGGISTRADRLPVHFRRPPFDVDAAGNLHLEPLLPAECADTVFDFRGRAVLQSSAKTPPPPTYPASPFDPAGVFVSGPLDSRIDGCQWHRIILSAATPAGTRLVVWTHAADVVETDNDVLALPAGAWQTGLAVRGVCGAWDCLVFSPPGRYLRLRVELFSNGTATPCVDEIVVEFPRISLKRYLPGVFGAEPNSAEFTDRFLSLFDIVFRGIEREIDTAAKYLDPLAAPEAFLNGLASWIGLTLNRQWPIDRQRAFLRQAGALYAISGTRAGLWRLLLIFLGFDKAECCPEAAACQDKCTPAAPNCALPPPRCAWTPPPLILEHYQLRRWLLLGAGRLGDEATLWGQGIVGRSQLNRNAQAGRTKLLTTPDPYHDPFRAAAHQFTVFVPARVGRTEGSRRALETLVRTESPAQTSGKIRYVEPRFRVGIQSTIGLDAVIAAPPAGVTLGQTSLQGSRTLTAPPGRRGGSRFEVGKDGRVGGSATL